MHTSGGRYRFVTYSPYVAVKALIDKPGAMRNIPITGASGLAIYMDGIYNSTFIPDHKLLSGIDGKVSALQGIAKTGECKERCCEVYFPLYNGVREVYIGVKNGSKISRYDYKKQGRVVYYGSSITQGGCASRPGNDYAVHLLRLLDCDYLNLGFFGGAKAEQPMADYISSLQDVSIYVLDYDHNAPNVEHLKKTHYPLYATVRHSSRAICATLVPLTASTRMISASIEWQRLSIPY